MINTIDENFGVRLVCPYCRDKIPNLVEDFASGDMVCGDCGLVLGDRIVDARSEWRTFSDKEGDDPSRVGDAGNPFVEGDQLDTVISQVKDSSGFSKGLRHAQKAVKDSPIDSALSLGYGKISAIAAAHDVPRTIADTAKQLYKKVMDKKLRRERNNDAAIAVCLLYALRNSGASRTFKEVSAMTKVSIRDLSRMHKILRAKLQVDPAATESSDLLERFCNQLRLGDDVWRISRLLNKKAKKLQEVSGKNPNSIAGTCVYMATHLLGKGCNAKTISKVSGIAEATIRSTYKTIYANCSKLQLSSIVDHYPSASVSNLPKS